MREPDATSPQTGTVPYDTSMILTRHDSSFLTACAKVKALRLTPGDASARLQAAHDADCTCGAGGVEWERTIYRQHA